MINGSAAWDERISKHLRQRLVWWSECWVTSTGYIHTEGKVRLGKGWAKAGPLWDNG